MNLTDDDKEKVIKYCKDFIPNHGGIRIGYAIEQVMNVNTKQVPNHIKEKLAYTITESGEYSMGTAAKPYFDINIYKTPKSSMFNRWATIVNIVVGVLNAVLLLLQIYQAKPPK